MGKISLTLDVRWPQKGDRPLRSGDRPLRDKDGLIVGFSESPTTRFAQILDGYMLAGKTLISTCEERSLNAHDVIYPILFCYRHSLEVAMKWIINAYGRAAGVSPPDSNHDLLRLWKSCKAVIAFSSGHNDPATAVVEQIIKDFDDIDHAGEAFRYSTTKKGVVFPLPDKPIDLRNLRDVMKGVQGFFDGLDGYLDDLSQYNEY
jgi:hypothetical protein